MKKLSFVFVLAAMFSVSCKHDPVITPEPAVKFSTDVQPIILSNCASQSGCHGSIDHEEFELLTYNDVMDHVKPGDARGSKLYKVITGHGEERMPPPPNAALTDHQVKAIYIWIMQGAQNN